MAGPPVSCPTPVYRRRIFPVDDHQPGVLRHHRGTDGPRHPRGMAGLHLRDDTDDFHHQNRRGDLRRRNGKADAAEPLAPNFLKPACKPDLADEGNTPARRSFAPSRLPQLSSRSRLPPPPPSPLGDRNPPDRPQADENHHHYDHRGGRDLHSDGHNSASRLAGHGNRRRR